MEKDDKGSTLIRIGVSGWKFLLVPAYPGCPGSKAVKRSSSLGSSLSKKLFTHFSLVFLFSVVIGFYVSAPLLDTDWPVVAVILLRNCNSHSICKSFVDHFLQQTDFFRSFLVPQSYCLALALLSGMLLVESIRICVLINTVNLLFSMLNSQDFIFEST